MFRRTLFATVALVSLSAFAQPGEIKIAHIYSKTGPLEAYGKQTAVDFMMELDYATGGTMTVAGKKLVMIEKDDQGKPDIGKGSADQINFDPQDDVAHIFCSLHAGFRDLFRNRGRFFSFYASFEAALGAFRAALPTMDVVLP